MECIQLELIIAFISLIVAFISLIVAIVFAWFANKTQWKILTLNQLSEKAKETNNWIAPKYVVDLNDFAQLTKIISSIIVAIEILDDTLKKDAKFNRQDCLDQFYRQLHPAIKEFISMNKEISLKKIESYQNQILIQQFNDASGNLEASCKKITPKK